MSENTSTMPTLGLGAFKECEKEHRTSVEPNTYVVLRIDGKSFHTYTKNLERPYDADMVDAMVAATRRLCTDMGAPVVLGYTQSDEISIVVDNTGERRMPWFGGQVQKMVSVAASVATSAFTKHMLDDLPPAYFDARVALVTPDIEVVDQYINWRVRDALKNSVSMLAHHHIPNRQLDGRSVQARMGMLAEIGHDWDTDCPVPAKAGVFIVPTTSEDERTAWARVDAYPVFCDSSNVSSTVRGATS